MKKLSTEEYLDKYVTDGMHLLIDALTKHNVKTAKKGELRGEMILNLLVNFMAAAYSKVSAHRKVSKEDNSKTFTAMIWHLEECIKHYEKGQ